MNCVMLRAQALAASRTSSRRVRSSQKVTRMWRCSHDPPSDSGPPPPSSDPRMPAEPRVVSVMTAPLHLTCR
jgi:hypothetical protein